MLFAIFDDIDFTCGQDAFFAGSGDDDKEYLVRRVSAGTYELAFDDGTALEMDFGWNNVRNCGSSGSRDRRGAAHRLVARLAKRSSDRQQCENKDNNACDNDGGLESLLGRGGLEAESLRVARFTRDFLEFRDRMEFEEVAGHFGGGGIAVSDGLGESFFDNADDFFGNIRAETGE